VYQQCYCAINTLTQPIKLVGLRICHSLQKIITCDLYWQVFDSSHCFDCLKATRNLYSETTSANMLPVRYTFGPFRAPSLSKLEGHVPLPSIWLQRLCKPNNRQCIAHYHRIQHRRSRRPTAIAAMTDKGKPNLEMSSFIHSKDIAWGLGPKMKTWVRYSRDPDMHAPYTVVKVVMCSRGAEPLRSRRTKISTQCCTQKLHFKLTAPVYPAPGVECFSKANP